jgi:dienelactone hydrolase
MYKSKLILVIIISVSVFVRCVSPGYELTGVVKNGLDGKPVDGAEIVLEGTFLSTVTDKEGRFVLKIPSSELSGISVKNINSTPFLVKRDSASDMVLVADKIGYQKLKYRISSRITDMVLNILPEPLEFKDSDYTGDYIPFTSLLENDVQWEDIIDGIRLFYEKRVDAIKPERERYWNRDFSTSEAYIASIEPNRANFRSIIGAVDDREPVNMEKLARIAETDKYVVYEVRWSVLKKVIPRPALQDWPELDVPGKIFGEGLLLETKGKTRGYTIAIPDAGQNPEDLVGLNAAIDKNSQFARHLAENGFTVVVPVVIDRTNRWSRNTNRTSRTWIYSQAHEMGRTVTGYEVQKMEAVIDWFKVQGGNDTKIGIAGYGEGGLLGFYTSALDKRVKSTLVSGYFAPREQIWKEPIYRNIWSLLHEFGDAELASLIAPRSLVVEYSKVPEFDGSKNDGKQIEPPGELWTHSFAEVESEFDRITSLTGTDFGERILVVQDSGKPLPFGSEKAMNQFMSQLGNFHPGSLSDDLPIDNRNGYNAMDRMGRMVEQMVGHTQLLLRDSEYERKEFVGTYTDQETLRDYFNNELIGWLDDDFLPINARTKIVDNQPGYTCYDVLMDVLPDVELWGILSIPKGIKKEEKRPVVVLQHGRGGNPWTAMSPGGYHEVGRKLADRGFVVFTPFGNWTGETRFRWIDRIAKPTKAGLWSTVAREHQQLIRWLKTLPFVDPYRIALYGKSIGGQTASLVASMIPEYVLSIPCAYFNEGARKETSIYFPTSFVYHVDSEMPMWNRGHTIEYAEMAYRLIFPRPFMVEHGKQDGIAPPEWVEYEYSKVSEYYERMGKGDLTEIDLHEGGHIINGVKSYPFLHKHLDWPEQ